jgi:hypothetical protein
MTPRGWFATGVTVTRTPALNEHQTRHIASVLGLLLDELEQLLTTLPAEPWAEEARDKLRQVQARVLELFDRLHLERPQPAPPRRRLAAYAGVWLVRLEDLRSRTLGRYGPVAGGVAARLEPALDAVARALEEVVQVATEPERP